MPERAEHVLDTPGLMVAPKLVNWETSEHDDAAARTDDTPAGSESANSADTAGIADAGTSNYFGANSDEWQLGSGGEGSDPSPG